VSRCTGEPVTRHEFRGPASVRQSTGSPALGRAGARPSPFLPFRARATADIVIKTILVGLDGSEHSRTAARYALVAGRAAPWVCGRPARGGHRVDRGIVLPRHLRLAGFEPYLDFSRRCAGSLEERGRRARRLLRARRRSATSAPTPVAMGIVANEVKRTRAHRGSGGDGTAGQRALLHRPARRALRKRHPQMPQAGVHLADDLHRDTRPVARLRRQRAGRGRVMQQAAEFSPSCSCAQVLTVNRDEEQGRAGAGRGRGLPGSLRG